MAHLEHYGTQRHSGRYPWGSGKNPDQRNRSFKKMVDELRDEGLSETAIAEYMGISTTELRNRITIAKTGIRQVDTAKAVKLKDKGYSDTEIGRRMGINESSVRNLLNPILKARMEVVTKTAEILENAVEKWKYIDVGAGIEYQLGIARTKLRAAVQILLDKGYITHNIYQPQAGTGKNTSVLVLTKGDVPYREVYDNRDKIRMPTEHKFIDSGRTLLGLKPVKSIDSSRVMIRYGEDGGEDLDGLIQLRRGVEDISLGKSQYAQVRIAVDDTHYMKGVAVYSDDIPKGYDIIYNTNKKRGTPAKSSNDADKQVFKPMEKSDKVKGIIDKDNPFGAAIKAGGQKGLLNIVNEEGDWKEWDRNLSSQMLSKQNRKLIKQQLDLSYRIMKDEFDTISSYTNPAVRKQLLQEFADDCDASAVHLKAAALPRQNNHVILPMPNLKPTEVFAPNYRDGEMVVLIRHPHAGPFEIPLLRVNNKSRDARKMVGPEAPDVIGIHPKVAEQLSGADFDGDTVIVIPTDGKNIKTSSPLKGLQNFNPKESYPPYEGMPAYNKKNTQRLMGDVSNLITDMTLKGASPEEVAAAVRHSMVVIDAEKHNLNYRKSFEDNGIASLKKKYQGRSNGGAATLISRAGSDYRIPERQEYYKIDPKTGEKVYEWISPKTGKKMSSYTGRTYVDPKTGKVKQVMTKSTKMAETKDAFELSSGTVEEGIYASYANSLKSLANEARKTLLNTPKAQYSPSAAKVYAPEVASLKAALNLALSNAPLERQAQFYASKVIAQKVAANPDKLENKALKKIKGQAIAEARLRNGTSKQRIQITPRQWEAIQAGAVTNNTLERILINTDPDVVKKYAMPRETAKISSAKLQRAKAMKVSGYTQAEIADAIGVSVNALSKALNEKEGG